MKHRMICILLTIIILTGFLPARILAAEPIHVLALGDSITTGYALANAETERFTALLGNDYAVTNKAVNGNTVAGIAEQLRNGAVPAQTIAAADVITITVGGNDIMGLLYAKTAETYNAKNHSTLGVADVSKMISGLNPSNLTQHSSLLHIAEQLLNQENAACVINTQAFTDALKAYQQMLIEITALLKSTNPNAKIIVATQYNPYAEFAGDPLFHSFYKGIEDGVSRLNDTITASAAAGGYTVADVKTAFNLKQTNTNDLYNADPNIATINLDFHPNANGHRVLAEVFKAAIRESLSSNTPTPLLTPEVTQTRAQVIAFLWQTAGSPAPKNTKMPFTDVSADSASYDAILWAFQNGITAGTSTTTFSPDIACTQTQMAAFLQRFPSNK